MDQSRTSHPESLISPQKIAFAGCWHANAEWASKALKFASDGGADILIHTGDFGYLFEPSWVGTMERLVSKYDVPIAFIDGNHDRRQLLERLEENPDGSRRLGDNITYLPRGYRWGWDGVRFLAMGGARSMDRSRRRLDREPYWFRTEEISDFEVSSAVKAGPADVLIAHDAPAGSVVPRFEEYSRGHSDLEVLSAQGHRQKVSAIAAGVGARLVVHGHYHSFYTETVWMAHGGVKLLGLDRDETSYLKNMAIIRLSDIKAWVT